MIKIQLDERERKKDILAYSTVKEPNCQNHMESGVTRVFGYHLSCLNMDCSNKNLHRHSVHRLALKSKLFKLNKTIFYLYVFHGTIFALPRVLHK